MARGDPYQYDDPEGVVNKEDEAEGNQAESNHLVCCCGLQRERESERDPHAAASAQERLTGTCCFFSPRLRDRTAAGLTREGEGRASAAGVTHGEGGSGNGRALLLGALPELPPGRASSHPRSSDPDLPSTDPRRHRRCPGKAPAGPAGGGQPGGPALAPGRDSVQAHPDPPC